MIVCKYCRTERENLDALLECCDGQKSQALEIELKTAKQEIKKAFWIGFEIARMNPDAFDIQTHWNDHLRLQAYNKQLKEQDDETTEN